MTTPEPKPVVVMHILRYGLPLCGFSNRLPKDWPDGHFWLGLKDDRTGSPMCEDCLLIAKGFRLRFKRRWWLRVFHHLESGLYFICMPAVVFAWAPSHWWHIGLVRLWRWEFGP